MVWEHRKTSLSLEKLPGQAQRARGKALERPLRNLPARHSLRITGPVSHKGPFWAITAYCVNVFPWRLPAIDHHWQWRECFRGNCYHFPSVDSIRGPWVIAAGVHINSGKGMVIDSVESCANTQNTFHTVIWVFTAFPWSLRRGESNISSLNCYRGKKIPTLKYMLTSFPLWSQKF